MQFAAGGDADHGQAQVVHGPQAPALAETVRRGAARPAARAAATGAPSGFVAEQVQAVRPPKHAREEVASDLRKLQALARRAHVVRNREQRKRAQRHQQQRRFVDVHVLSAARAHALRTRRGTRRKAARCKD